MGAVLLGPGFDPEIRAELTDSKKLSAKKRDVLNLQILEHSAAHGLGWVSAPEIDRYGLGPALKLAARRATKSVLALCKNRDLCFNEIIIDGTINLLVGTPLESRVTLLKKADFLIKEVSAASIIAKVARDRYMIELAEKYPGYGFEKHVGYGTAAHQKALRKLGPCPEHRFSFRPLQAYAKPTKVSGTTCTTTIGQTAEQIVADYLKSRGHSILHQNYKTKAYEIDLISQFQNQLFFTEVKYRQDAQHGSALDAVTKSKQQQMQYAARAFLAAHPELHHLQPSLAVAAVTGADFTFQDWFELAID